MRVSSKQKLAIVELRRERKSFKQIAATVGVSVDAAQYWTRQAGLSSFHASKPPDPYTVRPEYCAAEHQAAVVALRSEIEAARRERHTSPLFKCKRSEIDRFVT